MSRAEKYTTGEDSLGKALMRNLSPRRLAAHAQKGAVVLRQRGWQALGRGIAFRFNLAMHRDNWRFKAGIPLNTELRAQRAESFTEMPLVSLVVPLYNTPKKFFRQLMQSVEKQSYPRWELVLVDASDKPGLKSAAKVGKRRGGGTVRYYALAENEGIAVNTNYGLERCTGDVVILLDHDDVLQKNALYEVVKAMNDTGADLVYSDEAVLNHNLRNLQAFHFKPDYAPYTLRGCNYIAHLCAFRRRLLEKTGLENMSYDGAQDYDLYLRLCEQAEKITHIPKVLYFWRSHGSSTAGGIAQKRYALQAGERAINSHLARICLSGQAFSQDEHPGSYRLKLNPAGMRAEKVSVVIPSKDHCTDLARCLNSLYQKAGKVRFEVIVVENNSSEAETLAFYKKALAEYKNFRIVQYAPPKTKEPGGQNGAEGAFNFSAICNYGVQFATGSHILLLNNDTEIISKGFLEELLSFSMQPDVGAVGAMLYFPDNTVQHAGLIVGIRGTAGVSHKGEKMGDGGNMFRLCTVQNVSAVTGAALMVKKSLYEELGGLNEESFAVAFNDVDFCLRLREKGLWNLFTPYAQAYHYESKSRGYDVEGQAKARFEREAAALRQRHEDIFAMGDPFYNPHFTLEHEHFGLK